LAAARCIPLACAALAALLPGAALGQQEAVAPAPAPAEQPEIVREYVPLSAERVEQMVPKHPGYLGALAPANLAKPRAKAPLDVTGTWFVDLRAGFQHFLFGPPYPRFHEEGRRALADACSLPRPFPRSGYGSVSAPLVR